MCKGRGHLAKDKFQAAGTEDYVYLRAGAQVALGKNNSRSQGEGSSRSSVRFQHQGASVLRLVGSCIRTMLRLSKLGSLRRDREEVIWTIKAGDLKMPDGALYAQ